VPGPTLMALTPLTILNPITGYLRTDNTSSPAYYSAGNGTTLNEQYVVYNATDPQNPDPISANNMVSGALRCAGGPGAGDSARGAPPRCSRVRSRPADQRPPSSPAPAAAPQVILQSRFTGQFCRLAPNIVNLTILQLALLCDQPTINLAMQFNYTGAPRCRAAASGCTLGPEPPWALKRADRTAQYPGQAAPSRCSRHSPSPACPRLTPAPGVGLSYSRVPMVSQGKDRFMVLGNPNSTFNTTVMNFQQVPGSFSGAPLTSGATYVIRMGNGTCRVNKVRAGAVCSLAAQQVELPPLQPQGSAGAAGAGERQRWQAWAARDPRPRSPHLRSPASCTAPPSTPPARTCLSSSTPSPPAAPSTSPP
jgi:hypothetical protein